MEKFIRFMAPVTPQSATSLMKVIDKHLAQGASHIHLMLSSPGGSVFHGLSIHNFLRGAPIEVTTYNFGTVDSIGVVIFCAGTKRCSVPHARFLIHGVSLNFNGNHKFDEKGLEEHLKLLKIDYLNIARVIADTTNREADQIVDDMNDRTTLNPEQAKEYGLVHEITPDLFPRGSELTVIHEDATVHEVLPSVYQPPLPNSESHPAIVTESSSTALSHGSYFVY